MTTTTTSGNRTVSEGDLRRAVVIVDEVLGGAALEYTASARVEVDPEDPDTPPITLIAAELEDPPPSDRVIELIDAIDERLDAAGLHYPGVRLLVDVIAR